MTLIPRRFFRHRPNGQALPEFALILPVFMLIFMGILQFGFLLSGQVGLINSVREAARYGSTAPTTTGGPAGNINAYLTGTVLPRNVAGYSAAQLVSSSAGYCRYQDPSGKWAVRLTVQVTYGHPLFIPLVGDIVDGIDGTDDGNFTLGASESMRVENPPLSSAPGALSACT